MLLKSLTSNGTGLKSIIMWAKCTVHQLILKVSHCQTEGTKVAKKLHAIAHAIAYLQLHKKGGNVGQY